MVREDKVVSSLINRINKSGQILLDVASNQPLLFWSTKDFRFNRRKQKLVSNQNT